MRVLNIIGHPNKKSFNYAIHKQIKEYCKKNGFEYKFIDLYLDKFDPVLHEKESQHNQQLIQTYQERINWADVVVITSPVWWFRLTTVLEGFFDKILTPGFAYRFKSITKTYGYPQPLLKNKKVITFLTHGAPALPVKTIYVNSVKLRLLLGVYSFSFGWFKQKIYQFWSVPFVSDKTRIKYLNRVDKILKRQLKD